MILEDAFWRFGISGTLLGLYGVAEKLARRRGAPPDRPGVPPPRWLMPAGLVSLTAFYALIGPAGGPLLGGWGNLAGALAALAAMGLRYAVRNGVPGLRHPTVATRMLFYAALPLAVGVPWGWLALTAPAVALSAWCASREDRILLIRDGAAQRMRMDATRRFIPRIW